MKKSLKYIMLFISTLFFLVVIQNLVVMIPNSYIRKNFEESVKYYDKFGRHVSLFSDHYYIKRAAILDFYTDSLTFNMIWNVNISSNNYVKNQILMKYYESNFQSMSKNLHSTYFKNKKANTEYSRYWHGSIIYIKLLLVLFNAKYIYYINAALILISILYLLYLIYMKSKRVALAFLIGALSINIFVVPFCFEYFFIFLIAIVSSIISMKLLNKDDKYFYSLLIVSGVFSCFFDFLTCETLALTLPLTLRLLFSEKYKDKSIKELLWFVIKCVLIWLLSYAMTYACKWILSIIVLGPKQFFEIWGKAKVRIVNTDIHGSYFALFLSQLINVPSLLFPFSFFSFSPVLFLLYIVVFVYYCFIEIFCKKNINKILLICILTSLIPVGRMTLLYSHTLGHFFFDYRALMSFVVISFLIIEEGVINEINSFNSMFKRRGNDRICNKTSRRIFEKK